MAFVGDTVVLHIFPFLSLICIFIYYNYINKYIIIIFSQKSLYNIFTDLFKYVFWKMIDISKFCKITYLNSWILTRILWFLSNRGPSKLRTNGASKTLKASKMNFEGRNQQRCAKRWLRKAKEESESLEADLRPLLARNAWIMQQLVGEPLFSQALRYRPPNCSRAISTSSASHRPISDTDSTYLPRAIAILPSCAYRPEK